MIESVLSCTCIQIYLRESSEGLCDMGEDLDVVKIAGCDVSERDVTHVLIVTQHGTRCLY